MDKKSSNTMIVIIFILSCCMLKANATKEMKDPTQPPTYKNTHTNIANNDLNITAIFTGKSPRVIIGNYFFALGDKISDATITAIDADGITLKNEDGRVTKIAMVYSPIKTPIIKNKKEPRENLE